MAKLCLYLLLGFTCIILIGQNVHSQSAVEFKKIGVNEGLSQNSVHSIYQDKQGFLWIGTGDGLNRYDGKEFVTYKGRYNDTSDKTLNASILPGKIVEDKFNRLWFFSNDGLIMLDKKTSKFTKPFQNNELIVNRKIAPIIDIDSSGILWLNAANELIGVNTNTLKIQGRFPYSGNKFYGLFLTDSKIYGKSLERLFCFDIAAQRYLLVSPLKDILSVYQLKNKKIALGTPGKIIIVDPVSLKTDEIKIRSNEKDISTAKWTKLIEYPENILYAGSSGYGLCKIDLATAKYELYQNNPGISATLTSNFISTLFIDRSKNLWIGTEGGGLSILDLKPPKFKSFPSFNINAQVAANLMVKSIYKKDDNILAGTFNKGLFIIINNNTPYPNFKQLRFPELEAITDPHSINIIYKDSLARLWMNFGGVIGYVDENFRFKKTAPVTKESQQLTQNIAVFSICEITKNNFLIGTNSMLYKMHVSVNNDIKIDTLFEIKNKYLNTHFQSIKKAPDGSIYLGLISKGFLRIRMIQNSIEILDSGFLNTGIRDFYFSKNKHLVWMATDKGLAVYNSITKNIQMFDERDGLSNSHVYGILAENDSSLWVSTNKGINQATINFTDNTIKNIRFTVFTQTDGLQSNEFNSGAFYRTDNGEMIFGGVNGINWFKPSEIVSNFYQPQLAITSITINEKKYEPDTSLNFLKTITLPYFKNTVSFNFAALEFTNPSANTYTYILEGFDKNWINNGNLNEARYANLPPGNYTFKVKAANSDGVWTEEPLQFFLNITPPFWQTWWFRLLIGVVIITVIIYLVNNYISIKIKKKNREFEKLEAVNEERIRISKDMHDELGTGLTKISLLTEVTRQKYSHLNHSNYLDAITNTSRELTQKMGEIIWTLNPGNDTLDNLAAYLKEYIYETTESFSINILTEFPEIIPPLKVSNLQRQQIFFVTKEVLNNVLKHSTADTIHFKLKISKTVVVFELTDNGKGLIIQPYNSGNGKKNGLNNMTWRMEQVKGKFDITSKLNQGTSVVYSIPINT